jgi:hypothetical protein
MCTKLKKYLYTVVINIFKININRDVYNFSRLLTIMEIIMFSEYKWCIVYKFNTNINMLSTIYQQFVDNIIF